MIDYITEPILGPDCFGSTSLEALLSQSAVLLLLGSRLRGDHQAFSSESSAVPAHSLWHSFSRELEQFPIPAVATRIRRIPNRITRRYLGELSPEHFVDDGSGLGFDAVSERLLVELAKEAYASASHESVAHLLEASLLHSNQLVRVAAAIAYFELATHVESLIRELAIGTTALDPLVRNVAATGLARVLPTHPALQRLEQPDPGSETGERSNTSMFVHGTWARGQSWWQPVGDFHAYIKGGVWNDLYAAPDRFDWSGGYSDAARSLAGQQLTDWIDQRNMAGIRLMAHSHGGNVSMLATHATGNVGKLVLLSCPAHEQKYLPNFAATPDVVSVRVKMDLVILADRGGQRFSVPGIRENVLPVWFDHSAPHDPDIWQKYNIQSML